MGTAEAQLEQKDKEHVATAGCQREPWTPSASRDTVKETEVGVRQGFLPSPTLTLALSPAPATVGSGS